MSIYLVTYLQWLICRWRQQCSVRCAHGRMRYSEPQWPVSGPRHNGVAGGPRRHLHYRPRLVTGFSRPMLTLKMTMKARYIIIFHRLSCACGYKALYCRFAWKIRKFSLLGRKDFTYFFVYYHVGRDKAICKWFCGLLIITTPLHYI